MIINIIKILRLQKFYKKWTSFPNIVYTKAINRTKLSSFVYMISVNKRDDYVQIAFLIIIQSMKIPNTLKILKD